MKIAILSPSQDGNIDGPVLSTLRQIPDRVDSIHDADVVIVAITKFDSFKFDDGAMGLLKNKKWVLQDWSEFGWDDPHHSSFLWGDSRMEHKFFLGNGEYAKFDQFVKDHPPILTFQRELLERDRSDKVVPIEYCSWLHEHGAHTREEFNRRPLEVLFNWGRSSDTRLHQHAAIFDHATSLPYDPVGSWDQIDKAIADSPGTKKWASIFVPHYSRIDVHEVQKFTRMSKISLLCEGAGIKTFRHGEVCQDSIMAIPRNGLAWSYPWDHSNSIVLEPANTYEKAMANVETIHNALRSDGLYELYCKAMENGSRYRYETYLRRWVAGNISRVL